jgi:hypothetical protein
MLAFGDSAMWGNGLKPNFKYVSMVAQYVSDQTGREVKFVTYAHSGATLAKEDDGCYEPIRDTDKRPPGDLNAALPTVLKQEATAARDHPGAELVLLDGCINDVDAVRVAWPFPFSRLTPKEVTHLTHERCADDMRKLLENTKGHFKLATVIVSDYWLIISDKSRWYGLVMQKGGRLKSFTPEEQALYKEPKGLLDTEFEIEQKFHEDATKPSDRSDPRALFQRWSANSYAFLNTSEQCFDWAVASVDGKNPGANDPHATQCPKTSRVDPQRVTDTVQTFLATVSTDPDFSYGAGDRKRVWSVPDVGPEDQMYDERRKLCESHYDEVKFLGQLSICYVNPTAHPNVPGADAYRESISDILRVAWSR